MSVYILISLNIKQGRGSNLSSVVQTSAVSLDKMTGRGVLDALLLDMRFSTSDLNEKRVVSNCPTSGGGSRRSEIIVGAVQDADVEFVD